MNEFWSLNESNRKRTSIIMLTFSYLILILDIIMNIVLLPLYTKTIGLRLYGIWLATGGLVSMLSFFDLGISGFLTQRISREYGRLDYRNIANYFFNGFFLHILFMVFFAILGFIFSYFLAKIYGLSIDENIMISKAFKLTLFGTIFTLLNNSIDGTASSLHKPIFVKVTQLFGNIICLIVILFTLSRGYSVLSIGYGLLIRGIIPFIFNLIYLLFLFAKNRMFFLEKEKNILYEYYSLAPSIFVSKFGNAVSGNIEPTLIASMLNPEIVVYYTVTKSAANMGKSIIDRIGGSIYPTLSHLKSTTEEQYFANKFKQLVTMISFVTVSVFCAYFVLNKFFIAVWVNDQAYLGDIFCLSIAVAYCAWQMSSITSYFLGGIGDIKFTSYVIFGEAMTKLLLMILTLKLFGIYGLPIAFLVVNVTFTIVYLKRLKKIHFVEFDLGNEFFLGVMKFIFFSTLILFISRSICKFESNSLFVFIYGIIFFVIFYFIFYFKRISSFLKTILTR